MKQSTAEAYRRHLDRVTETLPDEEALEVVDLYLPWESGTAYQVGDRRRHEGLLYKCVQAHTSQSDWTPDATPALWTRVSTEEWPEWVQPTGAQDAYQIGDKVRHNGARWISTVDDNVWEPGIYGWIEAD